MMDSLTPTCYGKYVSIRMGSWKPTHYGKHISVDMEVKDVSMEIDSRKQSITE
jgi:hypothetical protein